MADLVVVPANVKATAGLNRTPGVSAAPILAGQLVYRDSDGNYQLADANGAAPVYAVAGVALCSTPGVGQPLTFIAEDPTFDPGAPTVEGTPYFLSATPGGICEAVDLVAGMRTQYIGTGLADNKLALKISRSDAAIQ